MSEDSKDKSNRLNEYSNDMSSRCSHISEDPAEMSPQRLTADLLEDAYEPDVPIENMKVLSRLSSRARSVLDDDEEAQLEKQLTHGIDPDMSEKSPDSEYKEDEDGTRIVAWRGPDDPEDPHNWNDKQRWANTMMVAFVAFISPASSSLVAPGVPKIAEELGITQEVLQQIVISVFILGYAIGPLIWSPFSEIIGRRWTLQGANIFFLAFNIGCGFAQNKGQLIAFRFLAGLGGSAPLSVGGGVLGDTWKAHERGKAMAIYSLCPLLGPSLGPLAGGFIAQNTTWRWGFWAVSIFDGIILFISFILLQETYGPVLLRRKAKKLTKETGILHCSVFDDRSLTLLQKIKINMIRPWVLLSTQIIIQCLALYMAFLYGLLYILLTTFPRMWQDLYHEQIQISGLNYISISLGYACGAQIGGFSIDIIYKRLCRSRGGPEKKGRPEFRIPTMFVSSVVLPIGLFWYGWSAQAKVFWIMPNIGAVILCMGLITSYSCIQTYIVDSYGRYAASALASVAFVRSLCGFGFPLFAPYMFNALGYGWGSSLLGFLALAIGVPSPFILWKYGQHLRARSNYAAAKDGAY